MTQRVVSWKHMPTGAPHTPLMHCTPAHPVYPSRHFARQKSPLVRVQSFLSHVTVLGGMVPLGRDLIKRSAHTHTHMFVGLCV